MKNVKNLINYVLVSNNSETLAHRAEPLKNFFFALRNSNELILKIIKLCDEKDYEILSNFLVHSCFENILNPSFVQEDMLVIIYLLLEQIIDERISPGKSTSTFLNNSFIYEMFKHLTRKEDVRSFLQIILTEIVLEMENFSGGLLCVQITKIKDELVKKKIGITSKLLQRSTTVSAIDMAKSGLANLFRSGSISVESSQDSTRSDSITDDDIDLPIMRKSKVNINEFFREKDTTLKYLKSQVEFYNKKIMEDKKGKSGENKEIFEFLEKQISNVKNNEEKYSDKIILQNNTEEKVLEKLIQNAKKIEELLKLLMTNLLENLTSIPYTIKCICKMIDILIEKKFKKLNTKLSQFDQMMYCLTFFFDTLIIPILSNPDFFFCVIL